ncbi:CREB3 regulatory factor isoform X2 [Parasteatoda tepidariorum]|uniref:CREB3 regulatory factor isoform X2 n=1 Tax=Parasteatoda tepidariorum TaxID=114398 RepID=UPI00077FBA59|nr:CREB3 regulatory factor isoform X2 [Parasteatoda tepidariorum]
MEKWKITTENSPLSGMDLSQIAELATAMMETWAPASSSSELVPSSQSLGVQQSDQQQANKILGTTIKQEVAAVPSEYEFIQAIPLPAYFQGQMNPLVSEQVPMDDYDPLESFSFWDGENFYSHTDFDACGPSGSTDMQMDSTMPTLPEYMNEDDMSRDDEFPGKEFDPTLAELNSCGDTAFEFPVNNNFMSEDSPFQLLSTDSMSKSFANVESHFVASPVSSSIANSSFSSGINYIPSGFIDIKPNVQPQMSSSCPVSSRLITSPQFLSPPYEEKFLVCPQNSPATETFLSSRAQSVETKHQISPRPRAPTSPLIAAQSSRLQESNLLSSSAPPDVTMATYFAKIKTEPPSHSPGQRSVTERSLSGFSSLSLSNDDESGSFFDDEDEERDEEDDFSSDEDVYQYDSEELSTSWPSKEEKSCQPRKHRYFWQYNLQSRGAKTQNVLPRLESTDPHILHDAFDPVFSEECALPVKHSGKARRGDGNDLTPDPRKLYNIGLELKKLNKLIYNTNPEGTGHGKPLSRKEKNKLASRVCRLKKKAQHEANKIKLYGLQREHKKLLDILVDTKELLSFKIENLHEKKLSNCSKKLVTFLAANEPRRVAGNTATFVNEILDAVAKGEPDGGMNQLFSVQKSITRL